MKIFLKSFTCFLCLLLAPSVGQSQEVSPNPSTAQPSPVKTGTSSVLGSRGKMSLGEVLELQAMLAESAFLRKKTIDARADLINIYESMIGRVCMPDLTVSLAYDGHSTWKQCTDLIDKVLDLDPLNPTASCARDGIDSKSCRVAYASVKFDVYSPSDVSYSSSGDPKLDLEAKLTESKNEPVISKLDSELMDSTYPRLNTADPVRVAKVRALFSRLLALSCTGVRLKLESAAAAFSAPGFGSPKQKADSDGILGEASIPDLGAPPIGRDASAASAPNQMPEDAKAINFGRVRLLPTRCQKYVEASLQLFPDFTPAICQKWGYYSPVCIDAKRRERKKSGKTSSAPISNGSEFTTF